MHTILVADDSVTIQRAVEIVFDKEPFTVVKCGSGSAAMASAKAARPALILADHTMGDQSGYDLATALRADPATAGIPVVLLSAAAAPYDEARGAAAGIVGFVQKPFDCATLLERVRTILGVEATAPGSFVAPATTPQTAAAMNMPRPPSLGGLPRPPGMAVPSFPPRPAIPTGPGIPAPRTATPQPATRSLDPFGLGAALSQPPAPAAISTPPAPVAPAAPVPSPPFGSSPAFTAPSTPRTPTPAPQFSSPSAVAAQAPQQGWQAMSPGQGLPSQTLPPMPVAPAIAPAPTPAPSTPSWLPTAPTPAPAAPVLARAPTPAIAAMGIGQGGLAELSSFDLGAAVSDDAKSTARISMDDIRTAEAAAAAHASTAEADPAPAAITKATEAVVAAAAPAIAAATGEIPSKQALSAEAKAIIERIVWEVVPELAEVIIKEELQRLLKARGV